jgi:PAS domain S-box-containing protein
MKGERRLIELLIESSHDGIAAFDRETRYTLWNPEMERMTGVPQADVLGRAVPEVFPQIWAELYEQIMMTLAGEVVRLENYSYRVASTGRSGVCEAILSPIVEDGEVVGVVTSTRDVTERTRLEDQLRRAQHMETVGQLAGGIAHDFNNLLTVIRGFSELLAQRLESDAVGLRSATEIMKAAEQAAVLVRQLLAFGRRDMVQPRELDLNELVSGMEDVLQRLVGASVQLAIRAEPGPAWILADHGEAEQILLNLAVNARDAMPGGGSLVIEMSTIDGDVVVSVSDSGVGMDEDTLARAFEPFYTTKPPGLGTGLGLATVYGIVERSGGRVTLESQPGKGTTARVSLPRVPAPGAAPVASAPSSPETRAATILLVEDVASVRAVTRAILEGAGYTVIEATDGTTALEVVGNATGRIDLVLSDVVMPGMSGRELAARLAELRPEARVVLMSGYAERAGGADAGVLLQKPFTSDALLSRLDEELGPPPLTCVVADDHPSVRVAVSGSLEANGMAVVGEARDGREALAQIVALQPSIAVADARMPEIDGIDLARRVAEVSPATSVIVYSGFAESVLAERALAAGARGFVLKAAPLADLVDAIERVAAGETYVDPQVGNLQSAPDRPRLTQREQQVLGLAADGMTNQEIASELSISTETVQTHVRKAMTKLESESRTQAVAKALRLSLIA